MSSSAESPAGCLLPRACAASTRTADIVVLERDDYVSFANCGLPYHIGGDIEDREALLLQTPESLRETLALDVRTGHEVLSIDRDAKTVAVRELATGREYVEPYDNLVLATGASPLRPPLPGIDHPRIRTLRNIPDMDAIIELLDDDAQSAVVVGGGYIGIEMVEALRHRGMEVTLVEALDQVMAVLDREMARQLEDHMEVHGTRVLLSSKAVGFADADGRVVVDLGDEQITTDIVILAVGVRPESSLAKAAGLDAVRARRRDRRRADAHVRSQHLRRGRLGAGHRHRHGRARGRAARRAGEPAGPHRRRRHRRAGTPATPPPRAPASSRSSS